MDERLKKLANSIVNYSLKIKNKEKILITCQSVKGIPLIKYLIESIYMCDGIPYVNLYDQELSVLLMEKTNSDRIELLKAISKFEIDNYDAFISIRYSVNDYEGKNINPNILINLGQAIEETSDIRINNRKWVLLNYPSYLDAYKAKMKIEEFYDYAIEVMTVDYQQLNIDVEPLKQLMEQTDKVRITGRNTDISFSIKEMPIIPCVGQKNIPDGEIYTAPIRESVNGYIAYNTPSPYQGKVFTDVKLTFKNGKIIKASCNESDDALNKIFNTDEGARYVGEFSLGLNPLIKYPMGDTLFDEKIIGSIHFTPGRCYRDSYNGNQSSIHWDMVLIQRKEYGGGNIYFDDVLIRKDGLFVLDELKHLNYDSE
jgi:aminopeptidase